MSKRRAHLLALSLPAVWLALPFAVQAQTSFHIQHRWTIGGDGSWDYLTVDSVTHRLYITHQTKVDVVDLGSGKLLGSVTGLILAHGIVLSPDGKTGFVTDGGANAVVVFDPTSFAVLTRIPVGINPDGMVYEPATQTLWAFNGGSKNATVIDLAQRRLIGMVALPGKPEFPVADGTGTVFVNIEDTNSIVRLDAQSKKINAIWPLAGCESPSGLALDPAHARLFSVCDGKTMAITDAKTGASLATTPIGAGPDADAYDPKTQLVFSSNGDGTLTVIDAGEPGYPVLQTLPTERGARTMALDASTGKIYVIAAKFGPTEAGKRPSALPGTFVVLAIGRESAESRQIRPVPQ